MIETTEDMPTMQQWFWKEKVGQLCSNVQAELESKMKYCLLKHDFNYNTDDISRLLVVNKDHYDDLNELWLDGVIILKWSRFSFKQDFDDMNGSKLIGSFEYIEV